jgi:hypothetical protein
VDSARATSAEAVRRREAEAEALEDDDTRALPWCILHSSLAKDLVLAMDFSADASPIPVHSAHLAPGGVPYKGMLWRHTKDGFLQNQSTREVLAIKGHKSGRKVDVVCEDKLVASTGAPASDLQAQRWAFSDKAEVLNAVNGLCLTVRNGSTHDHGEVWLNARNGSHAQQWVLKVFEGEAADLPSRQPGTKQTPSNLPPVVEEADVVAVTKALAKAILGELYGSGVGKVLKRVRGAADQGLADAQSTLHRRPPRAPPSSSRDTSTGSSKSSVKSASSASSVEFAGDTDHEALARRKGAAPSSSSGRAPRTSKSPKHRASPASKTPRSPQPASPAEVELI